MAIESNYFKVQNKLIEDLPNISGNALKLYLLFRRMVNEQRNDDNLVFPSYEHIHKITGISRGSIRKCIDELIVLGWISSIKKSYSAVNKYYLPDDKIDNSSKTELLEDDIEHSDASIVQKLDYSSSENEVSIPLKLNSNKTNINNTNVNNIYNRIEKVFAEIYDEPNLKIAKATLKQNFINEFGEPIPSVGWSYYFTDTLYDFGKLPDEEKKEVCDFMDENNFTEVHHIISHLKQHLERRERVRF